MTAWHEVYGFAGGTISVRVPPCDFDEAHDTLVILDLLNRVQAGFCSGGCRGARPRRPGHARAIWSNAVALDNQSATTWLGQLGSTGTIQNSGISTWFARQALRCAAGNVALVFMFLEGFESHFPSGPSSPWALRDWQELVGVCDTRRGSALFWRVAGADQLACAIIVPTGYSPRLPAPQDVPLFRDTRVHAE